VVHSIGRLGAGGAERQLSYLADASARAGHAVEVCLSYAGDADEGPFAAELRAAGVELRALPRAPRGLLELPRTTSPLPTELRRALLDHVAAPALVPLYEHLVRARPDVLHCWLDEANLVGALAGLAADVPRIVLSTRSLSPTHFPRLLRPWFRGSYQRLADSSRLVLLNNSRAGAADYASWSNTQPERWEVVHNGFDLTRCPLPSQGERTAGRQALGIEPDDFLVVGLFRLEREKQPELFLDVLARVAAELPGLRAVHVGGGPLAQQSAAQARARGVDVRFLGQRSDPWSVLGLADASLLTSRVEGLPNVAIESQALEVPPVLSAVGGAAEALEPGRSGLLASPTDPAALASHLLGLARDPAARRAMGVAGRALVAERFGLDRMVERTLARYR